MKGFRKVFAFTFMQHVRTNGYKRLTITLAILLFLLPVIIMGAVEIFREEDPADALDVQALKTEMVYVVDHSNSHLVDLKNIKESPYEHSKEYEDVETALSEATPYTQVILLEEDEEGNYLLTVLLTEDTEIHDVEAQWCRSQLEIAARSMIAYGRMPESEAYELEKRFFEEQQAYLEETKVSEEESLEDARDIFSMILPYVNIMLLYFLVLFYGQGVANSVVMEKSSKLMDTFLVSVKPEAMIFGKVFAIAIAGMMQFLIWILAAVLGFAGGTALVKVINPDTNMAIIRLFEVLSEMAGVFSAPGIVLGILMIFGGFILYCSLASIGGAIAAKAEDLASTNMLFTLVLVLSFFAVLYTGGMEGGMSSNEAWLNWVPFTSIMITPSRLLLADIALFPGLVSVLLVYAAAVLVMWMAARVYRIMSLYSGKLPGMKQVIKMVKGR